MSKSGFVLDTHSWIWLCEGSPHLPNAWVDALQKAVHQGYPLWIPAIAIWELGMLVAKGRLSMSCSVQSWVRQALALPGVQLAPLSPDIALESAALPGVFHGDPADRIIVATARIFDARLVTRDEKILTYASEGWVNVLL
jgi:PIN domain nuclease of toxin-antitoxin system